MTSQTFSSCNAVTHDTPVDAVMAPMLDFCPGHSCRKDLDGAVGVLNPAI